jgi:1-acyl-sn-glycerol-3-phosphate acyltransferase
MAIRVGKRRLCLYHLVKRIAPLLFYPFFRIQVLGHFNIPGNGPFLLLPKHQRWEDVPLLGMAIERPLNFIAKYELFRNPVTGWFLSSLGGLPLNRTRPSETIRSIKTLLDLLKRGEGIVIFPEGTYQKEKLGKVHKGLIRLILMRFNVPMIPVGINYSKKGIRTAVIIETGSPVSLESMEDIDESVDLAVSEISRLSGLPLDHTGENTDVGIRKGI